VAPRGERGENVTELASARLFYADSLEGADGLTRAVLKDKFTHLLHVHGLRTIVPFSYPGPAGHIIYFAHLLSFNIIFGASFQT
jgi:hypothetical protein